MRLQTSLLDRLVDDAPDLTRDPPMTRTQEMMAIRAGFCRDLEALLNTRRLCRTPPKDYALLPGALPGYGVEDFVGAPLATIGQRQQLADSVEQAIRAFEPRFISVKVTLQKSRDRHERRQSIRIEAVARFDHGPEPVIFETALDPTSRLFEIE